MAQEFWYGDEESHQAVIRARAEVRNMMVKISAEDGDLPGLPPVWNRDGDIAVIKVYGSLVNGTAGYARYWGVTGYADVTTALIEAASDDSVKKILMHVESPGGSTNGLQELAEIIVKLGRVKPIYGHTEEIAASAGYWLLCSTEKSSANQTAQVGSIGCIAVLTSTVKAYEEMGIDKAIIRSGEYKCLGHPAEPISDLAKSELQDKVNDLATMFETWVAKRRNVPVTEAKDTMGQGRMFLGRRALTAGLIDKVLTYDQVLRMIEKS